MNKNMFDQAIGEVPASTVDVDAAIARGRRAARLHVVTNPVVAAAGAVLVVVLAVAVASLPGGSPTGGSPGETTAPPTSQTPCLGEQVVPTDSAKVATANRLTTALKNAVESRLPANAPLVDVHFPNLSTPVQFLEVRQDAENSCDANTDAFFSLAGVRWMGTENSRFMVEIDPVRVANPLTDWCGDSGISCTEQTTPEGDQVVGIERRREDGAIITRAAEAKKADGTAITVLMDSAMLADGDSYSPPLTIQEVIEIALDPRLTMHP